MAAPAPSLDRIAERLSGPLRTSVDVGRRSLTRFLELQGFDRAMALAGQAFAAMLPLLIVIGAVSPAGGRDLADALIEGFGLSGSSAAALEAAVAQPTEVESSVSTLGFALLVISALSFTRALQRLYVLAWRLEKLGLRGTGWGLEWLACFAGFWLLQPVIISALSGAAAVAVSLGISTLLWLVTPWILIGRRIPARRLLPQALLTAVGLAAVGVWEVLYAPRAVSAAAAQFGVIGIAFALLSLLFATSLVLVVAAALGATLAEPAATLGDSPGAGDPRRAGA